MVAHGLYTSQCGMRLPRLPAGLRAAPPPASPLVIHGGTGGDFHFVEPDFEIGTPFASQLVTAFATALVIENTTDIEAPGCRVRIADMRPRYSFQPLPRPLHWWPDDSEVMDLEPRGRGRVVLARSWKAEQWRAGRRVVEGRARTGPIGGDIPDAEIEITVVAWIRGQNGTRKTFRLRGLNDPTVFFLDVASISAG